MNEATVRLNDGTNGNLTIDKDLRLGRPSPLTKLDGYNSLALQPISESLTIERDLLFGGEATSGGQQWALVSAIGLQTNVEHRLRVGRRHQAHLIQSSR
jgi:hypothetical protein